MRAERRPCTICGTPTQSIGYKAFVCGACSIFYRRNYRNHKHIRCRKEGKCDLTAGNRTTCRSCRMKACRTLGLRMVGSSLVIQSNGYPEDDIEDDTSLPDAQTISVPSIIKSEYSNNTIGIQPTTSSTVQCENLVGVNESNINVVDNFESANSSTNLSNSFNNFLAAQSSPSSTSLSDPRSVQSIYLPSTPLMNVVDSTLGQQQNSQNTIDDFLVETIVRMKTPQNTPLSVYSMLHTNPVHFPLMIKNVLAYSRFEERQRTLVQLAMNETDVQILEGYKEIGMKTYSILENSVLRLACIAIAELLDGCIELSLQQKIAVIKSSSLEVSSIYKYSLTSRAFPELDSQNMALFPSLCCRLDNIEVFMQDEYLKTKHIMEPLWRVGRLGIARFRNLQPTFDEAAVLFGIIVLENIERLGLMKDFVAAQREQLYSEFGYYLSLQYGAQAASVRLIRLVTLLCDVKCYTTAYEDTFSLLGVLVPTDRNAFWSHKPHISDTQLENLVAPNS
ncbi:hypothetical protein M3Y94_00246700 [Aphelenchoides besseyi]|nr:hypothetical protein M3Y94_00246700 [Aphelenchoides besseyi]